jgi:hypothetical protein
MDKRDDDSGPSETWVTSDVIRGVLGVAAGKSPDEVRSMLVSELRSRGIEPSGEAIESYRAIIAEKLSSRASGEISSLEFGRRRHGHSLLSANPARLIRNAKVMRRMLPQYQPSRRTSFMTPDRTLAPLEVVLDASARQWLASGEAKLPRGADPARRIDVWLDFGHAPAGAGSVRVNLRDRLIGYLQPQDDDIFEAAIQSSRAAKETLMTSGYIRRGRGDDELAFYIYRPLTGIA